MLGVVITICGVIMISVKSSGANKLVEEEIVVVNTVLDDTNEHTALINSNPTKTYSSYN